MMRGERAAGDSERLRVNTSASSSVTDISGRLQQSVQPEQPEGPGWPPWIGLGSPASGPLSGITGSVQIEPEGETGIAGE